MERVVKGLRIGRRRGRDSEVALSPLELALRPALVDGRWQIPDRFNFTRDVVEALARDPKRRALTSLGKEGVIEHRSFHEIADGAAVWATTLARAERHSGRSRGRRRAARPWTGSRSSSAWLKTGRRGRAVHADVSAVAARACSSRHRRGARRRGALARADDRADGIHARRPLLRARDEAELEGRFPRRPTHDTSLARPRLHRPPPRASAGRGRTSRTRTARCSRHASRPSTGSTSAEETPSGAPQMLPRRSRCGTPLPGRGRAAPRSCCTRAASTSTSGSICSSDSARASSASRPPSTARSRTIRSSSAFARPGCAGSSRPATTWIQMSSRSSRSAGG